MTDEAYEKYQEDIKKLVKECPKLFKGKDDYHFECSRGWFKHIREACLYLEALNNAEPEKATITVAQIKEKFGGLRLYVDGRHDPGVDKIIDYAEKACWGTCEHCGDPGELRKDLSWLRTLCDNHYVIAQLQTEISHQKTTIRQQDLLNDKLKARVEELKNELNEVEEALSHALRWVRHIKDPEALKLVESGGRLLTTNAALLRAEVRHAVDEDEN